MRALVALVVLAGSAHAGDFFEPPARMTRLHELPRRARSLLETRAVPGLGTVWRFVNGDAPDLVLLSADGAWWQPPPVVLGAGSAMGGKFDEVDDFRTRIDVRTIDGRAGRAARVRARAD